MNQMLSVFHKFIFGGKRFIPDYSHVAIIFFLLVFYDSSHAQDLPPEAQARVLVSRINQAISAGEDTTALEHLGALDDIEFERPASLFLIEAKLAGKTGDWARSKSNLEEFFAIATPESENYDEAATLYTIVADNVSAAEIRNTELLVQEIEQTNDCASLFAISKRVDVTTSTLDSFMESVARLECYEKFDAEMDNAPFLADTISTSVSAITSIAISPDGLTLVTTSIDSPSISVWSLSDNTEIAQLKVSGNFALDAVVSADGNQVAASSDNGTVFLWNLGNSQLLHTFQSADRGTSAISFHPSTGDLATSATAGGLVQIWNTETGELVETIPTRSQGSQSLAFSDDGQKLAIGFEDRITVWSVELQRRIKTLRIDGLASRVSFSAGGEQVLFGGKSYGEAGKIELLDVQSGNRLVTYVPPQLTSFAVNAERNLVLSLGAEAAIQDMNSGQILASLRGDGGSTMSSAAFSPNGKILATGYLNGDVRLWRLIPNH